MSSKIPSRRVASILKCGLGLSRRCRQAVLSSPVEMTTRKVSVLNSMQLTDSCISTSEISQKIICVVENRHNLSTVIELQSDARVGPEVSIQNWHALLTHKLIIATVLLLEL